MPGDQDELGVGQGLGVVEQLHAAAVGQHQVEQDDVGLLQRHLAARIAQRPGRGDREAFAGDQHRHRLGGVGVVVDEQGVRHFGQLPLQRLNRIAAPEHGLARS